MIEWLSALAKTIQATWNPWVLTAIGVGVLLVGSRAGAFYTSPAQIAEVGASRDFWRILRLATLEAVKNSVLFGAITIMAVVWDQWWLTGPLAVLLAVLALPTILQDLLIVGSAIPIMVARPANAVPVALGTVVRLAGDGVALFYLALVLTALFT